MPVLTFKCLFGYECFFAYGFGMQIVLESYFSKGLTGLDETQRNSSPVCSPFLRRTQELGPLPLERVCENQSTEGQNPGQ